MSEAEEAKAPTMAEEAPAELAMRKLPDREKQPDTGKTPLGREEGEAEEEKGRGREEMQNCRTEKRRGERWTTEKREER
jgi:hypothetical protein